MAVIGAKRHAGAEHFIVRQPDRTLALLPAWMTETGRSVPALVAPPRLPIERLSDLRALLDALIASCSGDRSHCKGAGDGRGRGRQRDLFDETAELRSELRCKLTLLLQALLTEAAGVQQRRTETADRDGAEAGDDQDPA